MDVSMILNFFKKSTRQQNDKTNKIREKILEIVGNEKVPQDYFENSEYGVYWNRICNAWEDAVKKVSEKTGIETYDSYKVNLKAGRNFNYDMDLIYFNKEKEIAKRKIEFKFGATKLNKIPQILSLQSKVDLFPETYDSFYYDNYLDKYLEKVKDIISDKPDKTIYLKKVTSVNYKVNPFFQELKEKEEKNKKEKHKIVNTSIKEYLEKYSKDINILYFMDKVLETQKEKHYLLWNDGEFHYDTIEQSEIENMEYSNVKNGNTVILKSNKTTYNILLRWRNHKGILNPAYQISMNRK